MPGSYDAAHFTVKIQREVSRAGRCIRAFNASIADEAAGAGRAREVSGASRDNELYGNNRHGHMYVLACVI